MTHAHPDGEGAPEQATPALFRDLGWRTVNAHHEVYADAPGGWRSGIEEGEEPIEDKKDLVERLREATEEGMAISVYQIQKRMNGDKYLFLICQHRLILESRIWHRYWMRKLNAWRPYPSPETVR